MTQMQGLLVLGLAFAMAFVAYLVGKAEERRRFMKDTIAAEQANCQHECATERDHLICICCKCGYAWNNREMATNREGRIV